ncbi:hypothetical protein ACSVDE_09630 [Pseudalkalibacillus sp. Hm43]|uniref:hypothetical protein n=1 Tax=Pseudalkalibacillus sp. Hm43 TaxID=3450742 RepID=UPI003F43AF0A
MRYGFMKWLLFFVGAILVYQNRYKLLNMILGMKFLRSIAVRGFMKVPGVREKFVQDLF